MNVIKLPDFNTVAASSTATLRIPKWALTLCRIVLALGGTTFNASLITDIRLKIGSRVVWSTQTAGGISGGTALSRMNAYRGIFTQAGQLTLDFTDRDFLNNVTREIGGYDMSKLADELFLEVVIGAATAPTLVAYGMFTPPQGESDDPTQAVQKLVAVPYSYAAAGRYNLPFEPRGSLIKRLYIVYAGTDWTTTTNGNLRAIEIKKNALTVLGELADVDWRFMQQEYRRVPQTKMLVVDFTFDNNLSGALKTSDAQALEILATFTAADSGIMYAEVLDAPYNL
ncbi:MAG: major capsid protein P2 [Burkholderiaceae bacterium]